MNKIKSRLGKIYIDSIFYETMPMTVQKSLSNIELLPMTVEFNPIKRQYLLYGISPQFDEVPLGERTPEYQLIFAAGEDGNYEASDSYLKKEAA